MPNSLIACENVRIRAESTAGVTQGNGDTAQNVPTAGAEDLARFFEPRVQRFERAGSEEKRKSVIVRRLGDHNGQGTKRDPRRGFYPVNCWKKPICPPNKPRKTTSQANPIAHAGSI